MTNFASHPAVRQAWHAVVRSVDVTDRPLPVTLCGDELVVWRGGDGAVLAAPDLCPHRQAQLSGGKIVDGRLQCPYHGWEFGREGRCEYIPTSGPDAPVPPRGHLSCVRVQERYGLVWLALDEPAADLPCVPEDDDPAFRRIVEPVDLWRCAVTRMVDNFLDIGHFPYVHVGTFGAAGDPRVAPVNLEQLGDWYGWRYEVTAGNQAEGAAVTSGQQGEVVERRMATGFSLPFLVRSTIEYPASGLEHALLLASTPVDDERSLFTFVVWRNDDRSVPDHEVTAFDRAIGAEDKAMLEKVKGTLPLDATTLVNTQADRASVEWRRRLRLLMEEADAAEPAAVLI
jgi:phenylpropionate dioxygenase-like ring-hydroxylating dioxygenase large terminal subunit